MKNLQWLQHLFAQSSLAHIPLVASFAPKWLAYKKGRALYNPKQILAANPTSFKLYVLEVLYNNLGAIKDLRGRPHILHNSGYEIPELEKDI